MFTGIIEEIGTMRRVHRQGQAMVLTIGAKKVVEDVKLGDSIAVNGVCLTVIAFDTSTVAMDVMPETYRHTNLGILRPGDSVNLERAMPATGRFGGHIVQGHVDSPATIVYLENEENAVVFTFRPQTTEILRYVVERGSITIDGISLTVIQVSETEFSVSIIPHTLAETILQKKHLGDLVNVETDIMGKYIEKLMTAQTSHKQRKSVITEHFLAENGYMD